MGSIKGFGRVTIVGTGQIGGSVALRLKRQRAAHVTAYDHSAGVLAKARRMGLAHRCTRSLTVALQDADLVILALPVASIVDALMDSSVPFDADMLVMDVGSTKRLVMSAANRRVPPLRFVGGHPLAGNERRGLAGVDGNLFAGSTFALVPGRYARPRDVHIASRLTRSLGARPLKLEAALHDRLTALTIGLPHVLAFLLRDLFESQQARDHRTARLAGSSLRSSIRVSHSDPIMVGDLISTNQDEIEYWWRRMLKPPARRSPRKKGGRAAP